MLRLISLCHLLAGLVLATALLGVGCRGSQSTSDTLSVRSLPTVIPHRVNALLANQYVEVLQVTLPPGDQLPVFEAPSTLLYPLSAVDLNLTVDQQPTTWEAPREVATWQSGGRLSFRNESNQTARFLMFYRVTPSLPAVVDHVAGDVADSLPQFTQIVLDNDDVRVLDVRLPARTATPLHQGLNRVVYALNAYQLRHGSLDESGTMQTTTLPVEPGFVSWEPRGPHQTENIGDAEAHYLVVGFRR